MSRHNSRINFSDTFFENISFLHIYVLYIPKLMPLPNLRQTTKFRQFSGTKPTPFRANRRASDRLPLHSQFRGSAGYRASGAALHRIIAGQLHSAPSIIPFPAPISAALLTANYQFGRCAYWLRSLYAEPSQSHEYYARRKAQFHAKRKRWHSATAFEWLRENVQFMRNAIRERWSQRRHIQLFSQAC